MFPVRLPDALTITHLLATGRDNPAETLPTIDAVFSRKARETGHEAEGAHVILSGETLYAHGCDLPAQATAILEPLNNPFGSPQQLDAYGWNTLKSVTLPEQLCEGDYRLTLVEAEDGARSNAVILTVLPVQKPLYLSLFKGLKCLRTSKSGEADYPYLLGIAADSQNWKTIAHGAYEDVHSSMRVESELMMGGRRDDAGQVQPVTNPENSVFHIGLGNVNNFRHGLLGKRWDVNSYAVQTPDEWGEHKATELWSGIVMDREFLGKTDLTQPDLCPALKDHVQETIAGCGHDTLMGMTTLKWTREEVETARQINGEQDVVKFLDVRCGQAHYRLEFHLRRVYA